MGKAGQGRENSKNFLREHPEVLGEIEQKLRQMHDPKAPVDRVTRRPIPDGASGPFSQDVRGGRLPLPRPRERCGPGR